MEYGKTENKVFNLMDSVSEKAGNMAIDLFEVSEGEEYLNKITKSLNLDPETYQLSFDYQGSDKKNVDPIAAFGLDKIEGLDFSPESVSKGYYDKVVKYIEGDGKSRLIKEFMMSNEFNNLSDEVKERYYNFADAIKASTSIATVRNSIESDVFEGGSYQSFRRKDGSIGTATEDNYINLINNVLQKNTDTGQSFNVFKDEYSSRNMPKNLGEITASLTSDEHRFLEGFRKSIEK